MHESKTIAPSTADAMVTIALNTGLFNRPLKLKRNLLIGSSDIKETTFDEVNYNIKVFENHPPSPSLASKKGLHLSPGPLPSGEGANR